MTVSGYLRGLHRRVVAFALLRGFAWAAAGAAVSLSVLAERIGASPGLAVRVAAWTVVAAASAALAWIVSADAVSNARAAFARRVAVSESALTSALYFEKAELPPYESRALAQAHVDAISASLLKMPLSELVPARRDLVIPSIAGAFIVLMGASFLITSPSARVGLAGLIEATQGNGSSAHLMRPLLREVVVVVEPPAYTHEPSFRQLWTSALSVPIGSRVHVTAHPIKEQSRIEIRLGSQSVELTRNRGAFEGRTSASQSVDHVAFRVPSGDAWIEDATRRSIRVMGDAAPRISMTSPTRGSEVELGERIVVGFDATDDRGLARIELVLAIRGGRTTRLSAFEAQGLLQTSRWQKGEVSWVPASIGAQPGDTVRAWLEARDANDVTGPGVSRTAALVFRVAEERTNDVSPEVIGEVLGRALDTLADRLHPAVPESAREFSARSVRLNRALFDFADFVKHNTEAPAANGTRPDDNAVPMGPRRRLLLQVLAEVLEQAKNEQKIVRSTRVQTLMHADELVRTTLESVVLLLDDARMQEALDGAQNALDALAEIRAELKERLRELRENPSEETRAAMRQAMAQAAERMRALQEALGAMALRVPDTSINENATETTPSRDAMGDLEAALSRGDLDAAEAAIDALSSAVASMSSEMQDARDESSAMAGRAQDGEGEPGSPRRGSGEEGRDNATGSDTEHVDIPREEGSNASSTRRRRALDALREQAPSGLEDATRRYLEGWLQ